MTRSIRSHGIAMFTGIALSLAAFAPASAAPGTEAAARQLVTEAWTTSRAPELYTDLRRTVHSVMIPASDDLVTGKVVLPMAANPQIKAVLVEVNTLLKNLDKAADEIDAVSGKYRDELIDDLARVIAKHLTAEEIEGAQGALRLPATRKSFDSVYMLYAIVTNMTYDDVHANQLFSAFIQELVIKNAARQGQPDATTPPTPERVSKATAITTEFMTSARIEDMIADGLRFAKEVVVAVAPEAEKAALRTQIDTFEQQYAAQKPMIMILLPTGLATMLDEGDLDRLQGHLRGPGMTKLYKSLFAAERSVTAFTVADIDGAKTYLEGLKARGLFRDRTPEEKAALDADMAALGQKWEPKLNEAVSPATREAIQKSFKEFGVMSKQPAALSVPN